MGELVQDVERVFEDQTTVFKLNLSFGFILFNNDTEQMQYHHSSANNNRVFETPFLIRNREDLQQVLSALENLDVFEWARQQRPNSKWIVMDITNATFYVTKLRDHPIGRSTRLPKYVLENPAVVSLDCKLTPWFTVRGQTVFLPLFGSTSWMSRTQFRTRHATLL